ncbi:MAG: crossover junction endodeoxyribonuclease RuvC [Patescibacteria group bacterium]|nr:crossover junction endodeoxyribonuclease RuvC [Patescibacteria group bacterium]
MKPVRILGIDPGFGRLGVSVVDKIDGKETLVFSSCFVTQPKDSFASRLAHIAYGLEEILKKYKPNHLAIETLFLTKNQKTVMFVAEVRGVVVYLCHKQGLSIFEYSPPQIKSAITGYGKSSKNDIAFMVSKILKMDIPKNKLDDEVDAIAVALTHSANYKPFLNIPQHTH